MKIVLIGYMGSGKSVVGQKLAEMLQVPVVELDNMIEKSAGMPIETIFFAKGELFFRKLEHELFIECMQSDATFVMSTGGGTPCYYNHHEWLKSEGCVSVYLKASVATLHQRITKSKKKRPLLESLSPETLKDHIAKHLFDRNYYYHQARHTVNVDNKSVSEIVREIKNLLA